MIEHMWRVAYADGHLSEHERHVMWRIADLLHVPQGAYQHARLRGAGASRPPTSSSSALRSTRCRRWRWRCCALRWRSCRRRSSSRGRACRGGSWRPMAC
jgi:hypothetical protein